MFLLLTERRGREGRREEKEKGGKRRGRDKTGSHREGAKIGRSPSQYCLGLHQ
jgi:hypothetical protein